MTFCDDTFLLSLKRGGLCANPRIGRVQRARPCLDMLLCKARFGHLVIPIFIFNYLELYSVEKYKNYMIINGNTNRPDSTPYATIFRQRRKG